MKSILVIGLGQFGRALIEGLIKRDNQIMAIDTDEALIEDIAPFVDAATIGDCTNEKVIDSLGVPEYDLCFVCIGDSHFQAALEITAILKEKGAKYVISKANSELHERLLKRVGADEIVFPDRDIADRCAVTYSSENIFDYIELEEDYSIYEITPLASWFGKTLAEVNIRACYSVNVIAVRSANKKGLNMNPGPNYTMKEDDKLLVLGHQKDLLKLEKRLPE